MAMNSPSGPIEATRNASMITATMMARDREKAHNALDERERDRLEQQRIEEERLEAASHQGFFQKLKNRLPFG